MCAYLATRSTTTRSSLPSTPSTVLTNGDRRRVNEYVARGAALLDITNPGWHQRVALTAGYQGVAGAFVANYKTLTQRAISAGVSFPKHLLYSATSGEEIHGGLHGFYVGDTLTSGYRAAQQGLDRRWKAEITKRQQADAGSN